MPEISTGHGSQNKIYLINLSIIDKYDINTCLESFYSKFNRISVNTNESMIPSSLDETCISIITHAPVHINDFRGVRARYVKCTG